MFTGRRLVILAELPEFLMHTFDLVLSNHVLYFVPDLAHTLELLVRHCSANGRILIAMAGNSNFLIRLWDHGYPLIGETTPYYRAEDLENLLEKKGMNYYRETIPFSITFPDSRGNRLKILRFMFRDHLPNFPLEPLLHFFDRYAEAGDIRILTEHYFYVF